MFFSGGILSSQRSEATNRVLNTVVTKTTSLTKFVNEFEKIVGRWRSFEFEEDFRCKQGTPSLAIKDSALLNHAATIYTCEVIKHFQKSFWRVMSTNSVEVACSNNIRTYEVQGEATNSRKCIVHFNTTSMCASCSCKKFESKGFVCSHILRVFTVNNVKEIPKNCILHR
ncbi:FAR1-related sequence 7 [Euphorbia peplus]|nr:FAR1-related sequence 7 [Euphorbia peplus]